MHHLLLLFKYHWQGILAVLLVTRVIWSLKNNEDLQEHQKFLRFGILAVLGAFILGAILGFTSGNRLVGWGAGIFLTLAPLYFLSRVANRAFNDLFGGFVFDLIFSEGEFSDRGRPVRKLPNITLLRHWRQHGRVNQAWRRARRNLVKEERAFSLWMFAAETAALYQGNVPRAERLIRRLYACRAFTDDERFYAGQQLKGWAAARGVHIELKDLEARLRGPRKNLPLREALQLRAAGLYAEAAGKLELLLTREPEHLAAALLLMQIYAQDLRAPHKARKCLERVAHQPFTSTAFADYARRSITEWEQLQPALPARRRSWWARVIRREPPLPPPTPYLSPEGPAADAPAEPEADLPADASVDELVASGRLDTALTAAEAQVQARPQEFAVWHQLLRLVTEQGISLKRAKEVVAYVERQPEFTEEQKKLARTLLSEAKAKQHQRAHY